MVTFPEISQNLKPTFNFFMILADRRDDLMDWLQKQGIDSKIHYPIPLHKQPAYQKYTNIIDNDLSQSERLSKSVLSLPLGCSTEDIEYIVEEISTAVTLEVCT